MAGMYWLPIHPLSLYSLGHMMSPLSLYYVSICSLTYLYMSACSSLSFSLSLLITSYLPYLSTCMCISRCCFLCWYLKLVVWILPIWYASLSLLLVSMLVHVSNTIFLLSVIQKPILNPKQNSRNDIGRAYNCINLSLQQALLRMSWRAFNTRENTCMNVRS